MNIIIELPSWLGDSVMTTPAIENLIRSIPDCKITLIGQSNSIEIFKYHPDITHKFLIEKKYLKLFKTINIINEHDVFLSFRSSIRSKITGFFVSSKRKYIFNKNKFKGLHQVEKYNCFVNECFNIQSMSKNLIIHNKTNNLNSKRKRLGINPGASYGSSKRWYPRRFADVALSLSSRYDVVIFGGASEVKLANEIEKYLKNKNSVNYINLAGKTSVEDLISNISSLDLFVTSDSGPMHIAAAFQVPTVSIFGPTNFHETSQWMNKISKIVTKNLPCQPCMKRKCPLKHHNCMKLIEASDILNAIEDLN